MFEVYIFCVQGINFLLSYNLKTLLSFALEFRSLFENIASVGYC